MRVLTVFLMLLGKLLAECDHDCACPDIITIHDGDPARRVFQNGTGCSQSLTCESKMHFASFLKESSNLPGTEETWQATLYDPKIPMAELPMVTKEYFTEFGLVCEDGFWFATKFPRGLNWQTGPYAPEVVNGKGYRARIEYLACY